MTYYIDRIEENCAVLQNEAGEQLAVAAEELPDGAREGSALNLQNGVFIMNPINEAARRKKLFFLMKTLFRKE